jgi:hypothetical protein
MENEWKKILCYMAATREEHDRTLSLEKVVPARTPCAPLESDKKK